MAVALAANAGPSSEDLVIGPYVNYVTESSAKILWVARPGVSARVELRRPGRGGARGDVLVKTGPITGRQELLHTATVSKLRPGQTYHYVVTCGKDRAEGTFQTAPPAGSRKPLKFVVYGDPQAFPERHSKVAGAVLKEVPFAFLAVSGDLAADSTDWSNLKRCFFDPARLLLRRTALWTVRGNHEKNVALYRALLDLPNNEHYYSFDYGNLHYVVLDAYGENISGDLARHRRGREMAEMLAWLDKDLSVTRADWVIVSYHDPTFNAAGRGSTWGRETVLPVLEKHEVDIVICGHSHVYERCRPIGPPGRKPIIHITSGGGGGQDYPAATSPIQEASYVGLHYCVFTVHGNTLKLTAKTPDGRVIDRAVYVKSAGAYQKKVMDAALTTEQAIPLVKVFKFQRAELAAMPRPGAESRAVIPAGAFPKGCTVKITRATDCPWTVRPISFVGGAGPVTLTVSPPPGVKVAATPWMGHFKPQLSLSISLTSGAKSYSHDGVPVLISPATLRRLVGEPKSADVPPVPGAVAVDGRLADWKRTPPLELPSTGGASQRLRLAWSERGLYGALSAKDSRLRTDNKNPREADCLELNVEMDRHRRLSVRRESKAFKLFVYPGGDAEGGRAGVHVEFGPIKSRQISAHWKRTDRGYDLEFLIPAKAFDPARMAAGTRMGFHFVLYDDGRPLEQFLDTTRIESVRSKPFFWGTLRLGNN